MIRRRLRRLLSLALLSWAWNHRGTVVRLAGLLREAPDLIRDDRRDDLMTGARAVMQLDRNAELARRTDIRIDAVHGGVVDLTAPTSATDVAQRMVADVPGVARCDDDADNETTSAVTPTSRNERWSAHERGAVAPSSVSRPDEELHDLHSRTSNLRRRRRRA